MLVVFHARNGIKKMETRLGSHFTFLAEREALKLIVSWSII